MYPGNLDWVAKATARYQVRMGGYRGWLVRKVLTLILGLALAIWAVHFWTGSQTDEIILFMGAVFSWCGVGELWLSKHESTKIYNLSDYPEFSRNNMDFTEPIVVLGILGEIFTIPPNTAHKRSRIKVLKRVGEPARVLSASEWFSY